MELGGVLLLLLPLCHVCVREESSFLSFHPLPIFFCITALRIYDLKGEKAIYQAQLAKKNQFFCRKRKKEEEEEEEKEEDVFFDPIQIESRIYGDVSPPSLPPPQKKKKKKRKTFFGAKSICFHHHFLPN